MAIVTSREVLEKYLHYIEFSQQLVKLDKADQIVLKPYLLKMLDEWRTAILDRTKEKNKLPLI